MGGQGATVLLSLKRSRLRIWEIENALFCGKPENPKFRSEFENATRNFAIPSGNPKFRVEIQNSTWNLRIPDGNPKFPTGILKFCAEFQKAKRNLTIPCGNRKFRVEFENSHAELRNSDRNFHKHHYSKRFSAACWTARLLTAAAYWLWRFLRPCYGNTQITQEAIVDGVDPPMDADSLLS